VGKGHRELQLFLVDDEGRLVTSADQPGELYLSGGILFDGYLRNPEETQRRLVPSPADRSQRAFRSGDLCYRDAGGMLYFVGRKDHQVQIFGNRVEPEEIEGVIGGTGTVDDVCIVYEQGAAGEWLHAFVVPKDAVEVATLEADLRQRCAERLPGYMVPNRFHFVGRLPLSANGKIDRNALLASLGS
jgi:acyl-CoA synthetase (AMP-forming)/AMP-acid ligase II